MLLIMLVVIFTMSMFLWLLALLGAIPNSERYVGWTAFFAVVILGIVVFLLGSGVIVWRGSP